jgi:hypothetical protein
MNFLLVQRLNNYKRRLVIKITGGIKVKEKPGITVVDRVIGYCRNGLYTCGEP